MKKSIITLFFFVTFVSLIQASKDFEFQIKCVENKQVSSKQFLNQNNQCIDEQKVSSSELIININRNCACVKCLMQELYDILVNFSSETGIEKSEQKQNEVGSLLLIEQINNALESDCVKTIQNKENQESQLKKEDNDKNQSKQRNLQNTQNSQEDTNKSKEADKGDNNNSNSTIYIIIGVVVLFIIGCCGGIYYIRRNNDNGFASLTANLENDKQQMIKSGGMMSMGSSSINQNKNENKNVESKDELKNQNKNNTNNNKTNVVEGQKKFSKRKVNNSNTNKNLNDSIKRIQEETNNFRHNDTHSAAELHLENNFLKEGDHIVLNNLQNTMNNGQNTMGVQSHINTVNQFCQNNQAFHQLQPEEQDGKNGQLQQLQKLDTSVQNKFFSIDGEEEEKQENIINSNLLDNKSDDTTYSNVFNLEGEESEKPHTNRKKKKQKNHNHLFFDDGNQEQ